MIPIKCQDGSNLTGSFFAETYCRHHVHAGAVILTRGHLGNGTLEHQRMLGQVVEGRGGRMGWRMRGLIVHAGRCGEDFVGATEVVV